MTTSSNYSLGWLRTSHNSGLDVLRLEEIQLRELEFPGDDYYKGGWRDDQPEGEGRYVWGDTAEFSGSWHLGLRHGWGKYTWPGGETYLGEWRAGKLQGYGTFTAPDGSRYQGFWADNLKHGFGTKWHVNGDRYEGLWSNGTANGPGRYVWRSGDEFDGEWSGGKMHGRGTFKWASEHRYDGEWVAGVEEGIGVFTWPDGSTYEGFWSAGVKHGIGVFRVFEHHPTKAGRGGPLRNLALPGHHRRGGASNSIDGLPSETSANGSGGVFVCEYDTGALILEEALSSDELEFILGPAAKLGQRSAPRVMRRRNQKRRESRMGQTIFKGSPSFDLMLDLQLGIRYTLGTLSKLPPPPTLLPLHFQQKIWLRFPREGSEVTPPHPTRDFKWKDYAPSAFRHLRGVFGIENSDYILSLCGDRALRELPSPGKSGSVFWVSQDEQFIIKTMRKDEVQLLLSALPRYCAHVSSHPSTLISRFYGVHRVTPAYGRKVRFVVMNNIFKTDLPIHRTFDLKGSTFKRTVGPGVSPEAMKVLKDLDLDSRFKMNEASRKRLLSQLEDDCAFLEQVHVMDYSLLLGVHFKGQEEAPPTPLAPAVDALKEADAATTEQESTLEIAGQASPVDDEVSVAQSINAADVFIPPPTKTDMDHELTLATHGAASKELAKSIAPATAPRSVLGIGRFLVWRREMKEKRLQKANQDLGIREEDQEREENPPMSGRPTPNADGITSYDTPTKPGKPFASISTPATQPVATKPTPATTSTPKAALSRAESSKTVTYNQQLTMQHKELLEALAATDCRPSSAGTVGIANGGSGGSGAPINTKVDSTAAELHGVNAITWRANAAIIPEEDHLLAAAPPNTPAGGGKEDFAAFSASRYDSSVYQGLSPSLTVITQGNASSSSDDEYSFQDCSSGFDPPAPQSDALGKNTGDSGSAAGGGGGGGRVETAKAQAIMRSAPSVVDLTDPEVAAMVSRIAGRISRPLSDRVVQDLLRLARYKMLGPGVESSKQSRVPASILANAQARRPGETGGAVRGGTDGDEHLPFSNQVTAAAVPIVLPMSTSAHGCLGNDVAHDGVGGTQAIGSGSGGRVSGGIGAEDVVLFVGVIDWLQPYNMRKKLEHSVKSLVQDAKGISVQEPKRYARRFLGFMETVFTGGAE